MLVIQTTKQKFKILRDKMLNPYLMQGGILQQTSDGLRIWLRFSDLQAISYITSNNDRSCESCKDLDSGHPSDA